MKVSDIPGVPDVGFPRQPVSPLHMASPLHMVSPLPLKEGDLIAILAPASAVKADYSRAAARFLESQGYRVRLMPSAVGEPSGTYSAPLEQRLEEFRSAAMDPEVRAVLCARGGYGCTHLLDRLGEEVWETMAAQRKWLIGFSDVSALHAALQVHGLMSLHAPMAKHLAELPGDPTTEAWLATLRSGMQQEVYLQGGGRLVAASETGSGVEGVLVGGNLAVLNGLAATPFDVLGKVARDALRTPFILFLEDVSEKVYAVERMLFRLHMQGVLQAASGFVFGYFTDYPEDRNFQTMENMIRTRLREWGLDDRPAIYGFPSGHADPHWPLLLGSRVRLEPPSQKK